MADVNNADQKDSPAEPDLKKSKPAKKRKGIPNPPAVILAILFVIVAIVGLIGFNIWRIMFNPQLVKDTLTDEVVSTDLVPASLELFSESRAQQRVDNNESLSGVNEPDVVLLISFMNGEDWREVKDLLIADEFIVHLVSSSVDGVYRWIDSSETWPNIMWDMTMLKERMGAQTGEDAIMVAYNKLPPATEEQIADFKHRLSQVPEGVEVLYNLAQFPNPWYEDQVGDYVDALKDANNNIPVDFNFTEEFGMESGEDAADPTPTKNLLRLVRTLALVSWIVALVLLALLFVLKVRSRNSLGKFIGIPLLISGAIAVIIALVAQPLIIRAVSGTMLASTSDFARLEITNSLTRLTNLFFQPLLIQGAVIAGIGIILIVIMLIKRGKKAEKKAE